jgi:hypothetical protein
VKKIFLALAASSLMLTGCSASSLAGGLASAASAVGAQSPAPLQKTIIDDKAVRYGFLSFDAMLSLVDSAVEAKILVKNTPRALTIRKYLIQLKYWLNVASHAQKAGSLPEYNLAWSEAEKAMALAKEAIAQR